MITKLIAVLVIYATTFIPSSAAVAGEGGHYRGETMEFRLGKLVLSATQSSEDSGYFLRFSKGREELFYCDCAFKTNEPRTIRHAPLEDCRTLLAYCFSGGAHCCTTLFIATECGSGESLDMADLGHSAAKVECIRSGETPGRVLKVQDWQLAYYGPENSEFQLSFACSPAMTRLLVFDNGHWRADRAGEFSRFYSGLLRQAEKRALHSARIHQTELAASLSIKAAYYVLMSGRPVEDAVQVLNRLFPKKWKFETAKIAQDISRAASEFNPVETIR